MKQHMSNLHLSHCRSIKIWILFYDYENSDGHQFNLYQQKLTPLKKIIIKSNVRRETIQTLLYIRFIISPKREDIAQRKCMLIRVIGDVY